MKARLPRLLTLTLLLLLLFLLVLLLKNGEIAAAGVRQGWALCMEALLPSLFPFLVLSELLVASGGGELLGRLFFRPVRALFGLSRGGTAALLMGALCGFPVGSSTAAALYRRGEISRDELSRLLLFANNPSPGFLIGTVGGAMLGEARLGAALFGITWLSAALLGIFLHIVCGKLPEMSANGTRKELSLTDFSSGIGNAFFSLLRVFAPVIFFSCISACVASILAQIDADPLCATLLQGLLEMTSGIGGAAVLAPHTAFLLIAFFAGFAGLSVCLQLFSVLEEFRPRLLPYLAAKTVQGALSFGLAWLYLRFSRPVLGHFTATPTFGDGTILPKSALPALVILLLALCACLYKRKKEG